MKPVTAIEGRAIPFGIGAAIGGAANLAAADGIVRSTKEAFGPVPAAWPSPSVHVGPATIEEIDGH